MNIKDLKVGQRILWRRHKLDQSVYATVSAIKTIAYIHDDNGGLLHLNESDDFTILPEKSVVENNAVNKPKHYMIGDFEVKDIVAQVLDRYEQGSVAHNVGSSLEYLMRAPLKNGLEDLKKARKCIDYSIENWEERDDD
ncbi:DUF3310 domain-containing protein [Staphylococcus massiliensis]|uniref:DUF3310 domain-containing protein n=1 Tax=Staphylococcus massiliensis TaxID=555791 RepID=UPI001EDE4453|nr:DUF3310 domain-containing protein [Staphylococcus massiliensis]MCG3401709.1 DUF3310 domain-containing protein [Staphylococcus massiliensis]